MMIQTLLIAAVAVLLAVRMMKQREFHVNRLWIMPALVVIVAGFALSGASGSPASLAAIAAGILAGIALGLFRASLSIDHVGVVARSIATKPNLWFALFFAATFLLKAVTRHGPFASSQQLTNFVICLTAASVSAQRLQYYRLFSRAAAAGHLGGKLQTAGGQTDGASRTAGGDRQIHAVQVGDGGDQRQPQTGATDRATGVAAVEALKD
jgi:hypothetical protein